MNSERVLITGAGGFIGRHLVRDQLRRGRQVRALDVRPDGLQDLAEDVDLELCFGDVADPAVQRQAVQGVDILFHLASAHLERNISRREFQRVNIEALRGLLLAAQQAGVQRVVHVSSCGVHGKLKKHPGDELSPVRPTVAYEQTKLAGEQLAIRFGQENGLSVVVVRPVWVYGPGCRRTARLFSTIASGRFVMVGRGRTRRGCVYITDLLDALERCATCNGIDGEVFICTNDEVVTVRRLVEEVAVLVGTPVPRLGVPVWAAWLAAVAAEWVAHGAGCTPPLTRRSLKFFTNDAGFTGAKARRVLGFESQVPLQRGLQLTWQWWREHSAEDNTADGQPELTSAVARGRASLAKSAHLR